MENTITKEQVLNDLEKFFYLDSEEERFLKETSLPSNLAPLFFAAYMRGTKRFLKDYIDEKEQRQRLEDKYKRLAVKIADKMIGED